MRRVYVHAGYSMIHGRRCTYQWGLKLSGGVGGAESAGEGCTGRTLAVGSESSTVLLYCTPRVCRCQYVKYLGIDASPQLQRGSIVGTWGRGNCALSCPYIAPTREGFHEVIGFFRPLTVRCLPIHFHCKVLRKMHCVSAAVVAPAYMQIR